MFKKHTDKYKYRKNRFLWFPSKNKAARVPQPITGYSHALKKNPLVRPTHKISLTFKTSANLILGRNFSVHFFWGSLKQIGINVFSVMMGLADSFPKSWSKSFVNRDGTSKICGVVRADLQKIALFKLTFALFCPALIFCSLKYTFHSLANCELFTVKSKNVFHILLIANTSLIYTATNSSVKEGEMASLFKSACRIFCDN